MIMADLTLERTLLKKYIGTLVRHVGTLAGSVLVSKGLATPESVEAVSTSISELIVGFGVVGLVGVWSIIEKNTSTKEIETAKVIAKEEAVLEVIGKK